MQPIIRAGDATLSSGPPAAGDGQRAQAPTPQQSGLRRRGSRHVGRRPRPAYRRESRAERRARAVGPPIPSPSARSSAGQARGGASAWPQVLRSVGRKTGRAPSAMLDIEERLCFMLTACGDLPIEAPVRGAQLKITLCVGPRSGACSTDPSSTLAVVGAGVTGGRGPDRRLLRCGGTARRRRC